jgi:uncharacterized protein (DUF58 family)
VAFLAAGRSLRRVAVTLIAPDEVPAGQSFLLGIEARSGDPTWPTGWAEADLMDFPGDAPKAAVPGMEPRGRAVSSLSARADRRGLYRGLELRLSTTYPFGLFRRRRTLSLGTSLVVTPSLRRLRAVTFESPAASGSHSTRRLGDGADLLNIRDYTTQDDARRIDWRASARLDRPMLREFEREQERSLEVLLDERAAGSAWREGFEELVSMAASILGFCEEKGIEGRLVVLDASGGTRSLAGRDAMIHLATVQARHDAPPLPVSVQPAAAPRIILSLDAAVRTRVHLETLDARPNLAAGCA